MLHERLSPIFYTVLRILRGSSDPKCTNSTVKHPNREVAGIMPTIPTELARISCAFLVDRTRCLYEEI